LILTLYENGRPIFTLKEVANLTGLKGQQLQNFLQGLLKKGILNRLIPGLFSIVPFEQGYTKTFMGNPYVVAREIIRHKSKVKEPPYFISHGSAFELHQMVTQPPLVVYACVAKQIKQKIQIMGTEFHFVTCKTKDMFGFEKMWVDKSEMILVSDLERTIIDGLKIPEYCGGITEVAKGLWIKRNTIDANKLVDYAEKIDKGAIYRRLGFLLELYEIECPRAIERLQRKITTGYQLIDPNLLNEGKHNSRWRLRLNVTEQEFLSVVRT
jgi:predicted transcriptional regulator of viral defense system